jgi:predicted site-specific integrase-resolvase
MRYAEGMARSADKIITVAQAAKILRRSVTSMRRLDASGELRARRDGRGRWVYRESDVQLYFGRLMNEPR